MMKSKWLWLVIAAAPVVAASLIGNAATMPNIPTWYAGLAKPWFTPPNWVFGPVWTTLYALMIWAFWKVLRAPADHPGRRAAIIVFLFQIAVNAGWSITFFGFKQLGLGVAVSTLLEMSVIATVLAFRRIGLAPALAVAPTAVWVAYATMLNAVIWQMNG